MLQIYNALTRDRKPTVSDVDLKQSPPRLFAAAGFKAETKKIWDLWLQWLFRSDNGAEPLDRRIRDRRKDIRDEAKDLDAWLFPGGTFDMDRLLEILLIAPNDPDIEKMKKLVPKANPSDQNPFKGLKNAFNYDLFSRRAEFSALVQKLDVKVCPYCGRAFTGTVKTKDGRYIRTNQIDHYLAKSIYPHLSLSLWNLIPVCGDCNHRKSDKTDPILYPYAEGMGDHYHFRTHPIRDIRYVVGESGRCELRLSLERNEKLPLAPKDRGFAERAENEIKSLGLESLYSNHTEYVRDIFRQRYVFGDAYIDSLVRTFPRLFKSREDVRALLYMKRIELDEIGSNPLDKLTRDIDKEIDELPTK